MKKFYSTENYLSLDNLVEMKKKTLLDFFLKGNLGRFNKYQDWIINDKNSRKVQLLQILVTFIQCINQNYVSVALKVETSHTFTFGIPEEGVTEIRNENNSPIQLSWLNMV